MGWGSSIGKQGLQGKCMGERQEPRGNCCQVRKGRRLCWQALLKLLFSCSVSLICLFHLQSFQAILSWNIKQRKGINLQQNCTFDPHLRIYAGNSSCSCASITLQSFRYLWIGIQYIIGKIPRISYPGKTLAEEPDQSDPSVISEYVKPYEWKLCSSLQPLHTTVRPEERNLICFQNIKAGAMHI